MCVCGRETDRQTGRDLSVKGPQDHKGLPGVFNSKYSWEYLPPPLPDLPMSGKPPSEVAPIACCHAAQASPPDPDPRHVSLRCEAGAGRGQSSAAERAASPPPQLSLRVLGGSVHIQSKRLENALLSSAPTKRFSPQLHPCPSDNHFGGFPKSWK